MLVDAEPRPHACAYLLAHRCPEPRAERKLGAIEQNLVLRRVHLVVVQEAVVLVGDGQGHHGEQREEQGQGEERGVGQGEGHI
jgi:hypothetical protein